MYSSPREESLEIALNTRKKILDGNIDSISIVRSCLVIATNLNKEHDTEWLNAELSGYRKKDVLPEYRKISCDYEKNGERVDGMHKFEISVPIHTLQYTFRKNESIFLEYSTTLKVILTSYRAERIIAHLIDRCLLFLNHIIKELQYGGSTHFFMEEIRNQTDEKLLKIDSKISDEIESLYINLGSTNPADWPKVAHSSRRIFRFVADYLFPPREGIYVMKDGRKIETDADNFINRLCAFVDSKTDDRKRKFIISEIKYLENYLRGVVSYTQTVEHIEKTEKFHASMIATHTYLVLSDILKLTDLK